MSPSTSSTHFALSRFMSPQDYEAPALQPALAALDAVPDVLAGQHRIRRWEYAMALTALRTWTDGTGLDSVTQTVLDVGGAGSRFWQAVRAQGYEVQVIDPRLSGDDTPGLACTVEDLARMDFAVGRASAITCLSVLEHVPNPVAPVLRAFHTLLRPGGLLVLTVDAWGSEGPDTAHFHWMRERIYNAARLQDLAEDLRGYGFKSFGKSSWAYPGPQVYDYTAASLMLVKKG